MKKKTAMIVAASVFVLVAIAALLIFVFSGDPKADMKTVELNGTWKVAAHFSNGTHTLPESEYITFTDDCATAYKDGATIATGTYSFADGTNLELNDISRKYKVERRTDNYIRLYESTHVYMELIRYPNDDLSASSVNTSKLYGSWSAIYRSSEVPSVDEVVVFTESEFKDYQNGSAEPVAASVYSWANGNYLRAEDWGLEFQLIQFSDEVIFFIETHSGLIWELKRVS